MYRCRGGELEFLLVHPGGPLWQNQDAGIWSIPKGEIHPEEDALEAAKREFAEELGLQAHGAFVQLAPITQRSGKIVHAWGFAGDCDPSQIRSNSFSMEWPPRSGNMGTFPEVDQAAFFNLEHAKVRIIPAQVPLLEELVRKLG
jgi:predicted NUDIX family NTP pyrophosphohydrolase